MAYSIGNLRELKLFFPSLVNDNQYDQIPHDDFPYDDYNHFPVILQPDKAIWVEGSLYLLSKLENFKLPAQSTLLSQAGDLCSFMNFMEKNNSSFVEMPKRKALRPTYQFRFHLQDLLKDDKLKHNTAKRRMNAVINFYRWLSNQGLYQFHNKPWVESTLNISYENSYGLNKIKTVNTTDLSITSPPKNETFSTHITDGGKLRPLSKSEQILLFQTLDELGNTEMTLIFLIAICTGARLQTICTLRLNSISIKHDKKEREIRITAGPETLIDTKQDKRAILYIPTWLLSKLIIYSKSLRASNRRKKSSNYSVNDPKQYLFLTKGGKPYYIAKNDPSIGSIKCMPRGNAITQFIRNKLSKKLETHKDNFKFRFHDLRATYGMNLVEINQHRLIKGEISYQQLINLIRERMWHVNIDTTVQYLEYQSNQEFLLNVQKSYEEYLESITNGHLKDA